MKKITRKICIISDIVLDWGGAESVLFCLLELYPQADLFTLLIQNIVRHRLLDKFPYLQIFSSPFQFLSGHKKFVDRLSFIKPISWLYWELLNLNKYDVVISLSHSFGSKAVKKRPNAIHVSYMLTVPKYLHGSFSENHLINSWPVSWFFWPIRFVLREIDLIASKRPDVIVAVSKTIAQRIGKIYKRNCGVIFPPVSVPKAINGHKITKKYFLCFSRLVKQKGIDLAVKTCTKYNLPLLVVGGGTELGYLKSIAGKTVEFYGECSELEKNKIFNHAKALIYPSIDEDFGIVPVEAMGWGVPVIAYHSGGVKETVINDITGVFFYQHTQKSLKRAINSFGKIIFDPNVCVERARLFSKEKFMTKLSELIEKHHNSFFSRNAFDKTPTKL